MPPHRDRPDDKENGKLIWAREDVVVTSGPNRNEVLTYYLKVIETEEIFELGGVEYLVWRQFHRGRSLEHAERAVAERLGDEFRDNFRSLVAELALRGLLRGAIPPSLLAEFSSDPRARQIRLQDQVDPDDRDRTLPIYRFPLFEPNRPFSLLARWFGFLRHAVWPILFAAFLGGLVLIKHTAELHADVTTTQLTAYGVPHFLLMLLTIKLGRNIVLATAIRYQGARIRVFSIDLLLGFWPRFHVDRSGLLRLGRTPQLWTHSAPLFARLFFFGFGALGWWFFRGDGTAKSAWLLILCQAGLLELIVSLLPVRSVGKNETYYWCCAYFEDPFLRERSVAALRAMFTRGTVVSDLTSVERTALIAYGLSVGASLLLISYFVITLFMAWTGQYRGAGLGMFIALSVAFGVFTLVNRSARRKRAAARAERRDRRRSARRDGRRTLAPLAEE